MLLFLEGLLLTTWAWWHPKKQPLCKIQPYFPTQSSHDQLKTPHFIPTDGYGSALALDAAGQCLAVGSYLEPVDNRVEAGRAYVYYKEADQWWPHPVTLCANEPKEKAWFGKAVALSADGRTLAVGSPGSVLRGHRHLVGTVTVFTRNATRQWTQSAPTISSPGAAYFGSALALSADGATLLVGCLDGSPTAAVYLFECIGGQWLHQATLTSPKKSSANGRFGEHIALSGSGLIAAVGAPMEANGYVQETGAVYLFSATDEWAIPYRLVSAQLEKYAGFGATLALNAAGDRLAVGCVGGRDQTRRGRVELFAWDMLCWNHTAQLSDPFGEPGDLFGATVAFDASGDTLLVGGYVANPVAGCEYGVAYTFKEKTTGWPVHAEYITGYKNNSSWFGYSTALSQDGTTAVVSSHITPSPLDPYNGLVELFSVLPT